LFDAAEDGRKDAEIAAAGETEQRLAHSVLPEGRAQRMPQAVHVDAIAGMRRITRSGAERADAQP